MSNVTPVVINGQEDVNYWVNVLPIAWNCINRSVDLMVTFTRMIVPLKRKIVIPT